MEKATNHEHDRQILANAPSITVFLAFIPRPREAGIGRLDLENGKANSPAIDWTFLNSIFLTIKQRIRTTCIKTQTVQYTSDPVAYCPSREKKLGKQPIQ